MVRKRKSRGRSGYLRKTAVRSGGAGQRKVADPAVQVFREGESQVAPDLTQMTGGPTHDNDEGRQMVLQTMVAILSLGLAVMGLMLMGRWV